MTVEQERPPALDLSSGYQIGKERRLSFSSASQENWLTKLNETKISKQIPETQGGPSPISAYQADH